MSVQDYTNLLWLASKNVGDYVHIYHDSFIHNVKNNVLGRYDDHAIGKIVKIEGSCVYVQYGSEANVGIYDRTSLGVVKVSLKPTATNTTGSLGAPSENKNGFIAEWSNFGKGTTVKVTVLALGKVSTSLYNVNELVFTIFESIYSTVTLVRSGGSRRVTLRKKKLPSNYTRLIKRV